MSTSPATRTSTDASAGGFRRGLIATIVVLALACAGLGAASVLQGPRIRGAQFDTAAAVTAPASMRIVLDEAVAPLSAGDVAVTPATPVTVQTDGDVVLVSFDTALEYDTAYTVTLTGVRAAGGGVSAELSHEVSTPAFHATWLERSPGGDRIQSGSLGGEATTLFTAARIQDYLPLDAAALLVVTLDDSGASSAAIVATDGSGNAEELTLPGGEPGRIEALELAGTNVLYTFTTLETDAVPIPALDQQLFRLDLLGTHISDPVNRLDGSALAVDSLIPIRGSTAALIHTRAGEVMRYDPAGGEPPALVTKYNEMVALAGDRHRLSVTDAFGPLIYDFDDGSETRVVPSPVAGSGELPFIADVIPVRDGRRVERAVVPAEDFTSFESFIAIDDTSTASLLYDTAEPGGSILNYRVTPNDRYLVAEVSPGGDSFEASDGYAAQPRPRDVVTVVLDIWAGTVAAEWPGSMARWAGGVGSRE